MSKVGEIGKIPFIEIAFLTDSTAPFLMTALLTNLAY